MFDVERFVADCRAANAEGGEKAVRELIVRTVERPAPLIQAIGAPSRGIIQPLYRGDDLTVLNVVWAPGMHVPPHDHRMWAVIGVYAGREDNIFWRRHQTGAGDVVEAAGARSLGERETIPLGHDIVHSVLNPLDRCTGGLHVYGGDFYGAERSEWEPESLTRRPFDIERTKRRFEESNARLDAA